MDLTDLDLAGLALEDSTLDGACLHRSRFGDVYLRSCTVRDADFTDAWLSKGDVHDSDLSGAIFRRAKLIKWDVYDSMLLGADFTEADMNRTFFCECDLREARFRNVELIDVGMTDCILTGADFTGSSGTLSPHPINVGTQRRHDGSMATKHSTGSEPPARWRSAGGCRGCIETPRC